jgi:hypothetical protein
MELLLTCSWNVVVGIGDADQQYNNCEDKKVIHLFVDNLFLPAPLCFDGSYLCARLCMYKPSHRGRLATFFLNVAVVVGAAEAVFDCLNDSVCVVQYNALEKNPGSRPQADL